MTSPGIPRPKLHSFDLIDNVVKMRGSINKLQRPNNESGWETTVTNVLTSTAPHSVSGIRARRIGQAVSIMISVTLGAALTVGSDGNIADTPIATLKNPFAPTAAPYVQTITSISSPLVIGFVNGANQSISIAISVPGATLASGASVIFGGVYFL